LAVDQGGVSDGVGSEHIPQGLMKRMVGYKGSRYVFLNRQEEQCRVGLFDLQQLIIVPWMLKPSIMCLASNRKHVAIILLLQNAALINVEQFEPSLLVDYLLLVGQQLQVLIGHIVTSDTSKA